MSNTVIGIDYSITSPSFCLLTPNVTLIAVMTGVKHCQGTFFAPGNVSITGIPYPEWGCAEQRYDYLSETFMSVMSSNREIPVFIEGYSMGSKGKVFNLAENMGLLKWKMWKDGIKFTEVPPTVLKKHATGKGNADKAKMYETYQEKTGIDLRYLLYTSRGRKAPAIGSPLSDIVDSWFIAQYGKEEIA